MKVTLAVSTGKKVVVWLQQDAFHARLKGEAHEPEVCLGVDLFEVIADLSGLDLEDAGQALEAIRLADEARQRLERAGERERQDEGRPRRDEAAKRCS